MKSLKLAMLTVVAGTIGAHAEPAKPPLSGFQCFKVDLEALHISSENAWAGKGFPPVFAIPDGSSKPIGSQLGLAYVTWPLKKQNGYVQILRANGQIGWVAENAVRPLRKADGTVGGCTLSRGADGRIISKLDPGVAVRY